MQKLSSDDTSRKRVNYSEVLGSKLMSQTFKKSVIELIERFPFIENRMRSKKSVIILKEISLYGTW